MDELNNLRKQLDEKTAFKNQHVEQPDGIWGLVQKLLDKTENDGGVSRTVKKSLHRLFNRYREAVKEQEKENKFQVRVSPGRFKPLLAEHFDPNLNNHSRPQNINQQPVRVLDHTSDLGKPVYRVIGGPLTRKVQANRPAYLHTETGLRLDGDKIQTKRSSHAVYLSPGPNQSGRKRSTTSAKRGPIYPVNNSAVTDIEGSKDGEWDPNGTRPIPRWGGSHYDYKVTTGLYNTVLKKRLSFGNKLEILNQEMKRKNQSMTTLKEKAKKYESIRGEYLHLCYQESVLRHHISTLQAEIYLMQNKHFHRQPAAVTTITLDPKSANIGIYGDSSGNSDMLERNQSSLFPPLRAPRPLITAQHKLNQTKACERFERQPEEFRKEMSKIQSENQRVLPKLPEKFSTVNASTTKGTQPVYTFYSFTPPVAPKKQPQRLIMSDGDGEIKTRHRLPKLIYPMTYTKSMIIKAPSSSEMIRRTASSDL